ncbi:hypothetical protein Y032_0428g1277 [Ancylostoma ceylanicum]|uniref:Carbohydrate sulfotransferase n=1 Tax=Ancylostoma ceylanicum TaxID=53326 RepID=A0A016X2B4_9BILA|nr:hypothetical protein Y032_0428g1277 [Ancylostoma ceylanicum]
MSKSSTLEDEKNPQETCPMPNCEEGRLVQYITKTRPVNYCVGDGASKCVPPLLPYKQRYRFKVAAKYKLLGCVIEKNFSTMLTAILCFLFDEDRFRQNKRNLTTEYYHQRFCQNLNEYESLSAADSRFKIDIRTWSMMAIVRDPVDRFVSGFADKCLREQVWKKFPLRCNGCKTNLTCFMEREYKRMMQRAAEFRRLGNFDDDHFFPQSWRCEFSSRLHDYYVLKFDTFDPSGFIDDLCLILRQSNVSEPTINFIKTSITSGRTTHSTKDSKERSETKHKLLSSRYLTDLLIKMYYYDFVLFGFPIPEVEVKN